MKNFALILCSLFILSSCGPKIYVSPSFDKIKKNHETVAILPFDVTIISQKLPKGTTLEMIKDQEKSNGYSMQSNVYTYFLRQSGRRNYTVTFQDVDKTNAKFETAGLSYEKLKVMPKEEIAKLLGVDAVISGKMVQEKPMNDGAALAVGLVLGVWGATNEVNTTVNIHDGMNGNLLWKYDHVASGSVGSSTESLSKALMKNVSKKFPYVK